MAFASVKEYTAGYLSPAGWLEIRCTEEYISRVVFTSSKPACSEYLPPVAMDCVQEMDAWFKGELKDFSLPLKPEGTGFRLRIWELLRQIPYGKAISYSALASQYGDLRAIRAVAAANGSNPIAIIIPCHRVIGSDGRLTGYAGGLERKRWLLDHEARHSGVYQLRIS